MTASKALTCTEVLARLKLTAVEKCCRNCIDRNAMFVFKLSTPNKLPVYGVVCCHCAALILDERRKARRATTEFSHRTIELHLDPNVDVDALAS